MSSGLYLSIDHPAIACRDVAAQIDWYCRSFGMTIVGSNGQDPPSVVLGFDQGMAGALIELMPAREPGPHPVDVPRFCVGLRHLALRVSDFDAALRRLTDAGIPMLFAPTDAVGGGKIVSFRDPEGNELQIVQRPAARPAAS